MPHFTVKMNAFSVHHNPSGSIFSNSHGWHLGLVGFGFGWGITSQVQSMNASCNKRRVQINHETIYWKFFRKYLCPSVNLIWDKLYGSRWCYRNLKIFKNNILTYLKIPWFVPFISNFIQKKWINQYNLEMLWFK